MSAAAPEAAAPAPVLGPDPRVGVGVLIFRGGKVLVGKRLNSHGDGEYALPGGHLDHGESWAECGAREVMEEAGIVVEDLQLAHVNNNVMGRGKHYITIFMRCEYPEGLPEPRNLEPHKCEKWTWVDFPEGVPEPVFMPLKFLMESLGGVPFTTWLGGRPKY